MDQIFETFMGELREANGPEEETVTSLCKSDHPKVSGVHIIRTHGVPRSTEKKKNSQRNTPVFNEVLQVDLSMYLSLRKLSLYVGVRGAH